MINATTKSKNSFSDVKTYSHGHFFHLIKFLRNREHVKIIPVEKLEKKINNATFVNGSQKACKILYFYFRLIYFSLIAIQDLTLDHRFLGSAQVNES